MSRQKAATLHVATNAGDQDMQGELCVMVPLMVPPTVRLMFGIPIMCRQATQSGLYAFNEYVNSAPFLYFTVKDIVS